MNPTSPCKVAILRDLAAIGIELEAWDSPFNLANRYQRLPTEVVAIFLRHLPLADTAFEAEDLVRNLQRPDRPFDGMPLIEAFERFDDDGARGQMGLTLWLAKPIGVAEWLVKTIQDPRYGSARGWLLPALANAVPPEVALPIIEPLAEDLPHGAVPAWAICGGERELARMEAELMKYEAIKRLRWEDPWPSPFERDEMRKAVGRIRTRLNRGKRPSRLAPVVSDQPLSGPDLLAPELGGT